MENCKKTNAFSRLAAKRHLSNERARGSDQLEIREMQEAEFDR